MSDRYPVRWAGRPIAWLKAGYVTLFLTGQFLFTDVLIGSFRPQVLALGIRHMGEAAKLTCH